MKSTHLLGERTSRNGNSQNCLVSKERAPHTTVRRYQQQKHQHTKYDSLLCTLRARAHNRTRGRAYASIYSMWPLCVCACGSSCIQLNGLAVWVNWCDCVRVCMCLCQSECLFNGVSVWTERILARNLHSCRARVSTHDARPHACVSFSSLHSPACAFLTHAAVLGE